MDRDERPPGLRPARPAGAPEEASPRPSFHLSLGQVLASSLAAASAATVASVFGVAGTVIGTALGSVVATVATAVYQHAGQRTAHRLAGMAGPLLERQQRDRRWDLAALPWRRILPSAALVCVIALAGIVAVEWAAVGKPLSALLGRNNDTGTSLTPKHHHRVSRTRGPAYSPPIRTPSPSSPPTSTASPTSTVSSTRSVSPTATGTTNPLGTAGPTPTGTGTSPQHTPLPTGTAPGATPPVTRRPTTLPTR